MNQLNNNFNQPKQTRRGSIQLYFDKQIEILRLENKQLRDSIILQQKSISLHVKQKKVLELKLKSYQKEIFNLTHQINQLRKIKSDLTPKHNLEDNTTQKSNHSYKQAEKTVSRKGSNQIGDIVVELQQQDKIQTAQTKNNNNLRLTSCLRKMASFESREKKSVDIMNRLDSNSEPILRTLKDFRLSHQFIQGFAIKDRCEQEGKQVKKLVKKKSYLQKILENEIPK